MRPTTDGWLAGLGAGALGGIGLWSGNNALLLVAAPAWAVLLLAAVVGALNVRGVRVERRWPDELVAGRSGRGTLVVTRRRGASHDLEIVDDGAEVTLEHARGRLEVPCAWRFPARGPTSVTGFVVRSTWPFGLFEHTRRIEAPDEVLVGVRPAPTGLDEALHLGEGRPGRDGRVGTGELVGLRAYVPGDPLRRVHWPTSARVGAPIVVERTEDQDPAIVVRVAPQPDDRRWERELSRAAGRIQHAFRRGLRVGLEVPAVAGLVAASWPARAGEAWRRHLLDVLARLPRTTP